MQALPVQGVRPPPTPLRPFSPPLNPRGAQDCNKCDVCFKTLRKCLCREAARAARRSSQWLVDGTYERKAAYKRAVDEKRTFSRVFALIAYDVMWLSKNRPGSIDPAVSRRFAAAANRVSDVCSTGALWNTLGATPRRILEEDGVTHTDLLAVATALRDNPPDGAPTADFIVYTSLHQSLAHRRRRGAGDAGPAVDDDNDSSSDDDDDDNDDAQQQCGRYERLPRGMGELKGGSSKRPFATRRVGAGLGFQAFRAGRHHDVYANGLAHFQALVCRETVPMMLMLELLANKTTYEAAEGFFGGRITKLTGDEGVEVPLPASDGAWMAAAAAVKEIVESICTTAPVVTDDIHRVPEDKRPEE